MNIIKKLIFVIQQRIDEKVRQTLLAALPCFIALRYAEKAKAAAELGMPALADHYIELAETMLNADFNE